MKELKRPQPLVRAREVFRGEPTDAVAALFVLRDNEGKVHAAGAMRAISFVEQEYVLFGPNAPIKLNLPKKANISGIVSGRLLVTLDEDWILSGSIHFAAGDDLVWLGQMEQRSAARDAIARLPARAAASAQRVPGHQELVDGEP